MGRQTLRDSVFLGELFHITRHLLKLAMEKHFSDLCKCITVDMPHCVNVCEMHFWCKLIHSRATENVTKVYGVIDI